MDIINNNMNSIFVYIKYSYKQLGLGEKWFYDQCKNNVCVVGHNISAYDAVLLNDAVHQLNTPNKLFGLDTVDTLIYSDKKYHADTIQFTTVQQEQLAEALRVYATYLQNAGVDEIATIISRDQMSCIDEMCNAIIHDIAHLTSPTK